jgi:Holliday junction resolvasome RuvABC endonuclease subunit
MGQLEAWAEHKKIPYAGVPVGTIKKHVTGKGNVSKEEVIRAVMDRGYTPMDDNEADALALLLWAIEAGPGGSLL